jgi:hypothetical protein
MTGVVIKNTSQKMIFIKSVRQLLDAVLAPGAIEFGM